MSELAEWDSFYVIIGSAAGALIGLQFVVMTLIADRPSQYASEAGGAFATPTIVHFTVTLVLSALVRVPWHAPAPLMWVIMGIGIGGAAYLVAVLLRMKRQRAYRPEFEDWLFHLLLPLAAYLTFVVAATVISTHLRDGLLIVAGAVLLLLIVGIHNAWDAVSYHVLVQKRSDAERK
jgi:hypothetical protein